MSIDDPKSARLPEKTSKSRLKEFRKELAMEREEKAEPFKMPMGFKAKASCRYCYGRGWTGRRADSTYDKCRCLKRI